MPEQVGLEELSADSAKRPPLERVERPSWFVLQKGGHGRNPLMKDVISESVGRPVQRSVLSHARRPLVRNQLAANISYSPTSHRGDEETQQGRLPWLAFRG